MAPHLPLVLVTVAEAVAEITRLPFDGIPGQEATISRPRPAPVFGGTQDSPGRLCLH
jgi:hypothetical protein